MYIPWFKHWALSDDTRVDRLMTLTLWSFRDNHLILTDKFRKLFGCSKMLVSGEKYHILNTLFFWCAEKGAVWQVNEWSVWRFKRKLQVQTLYRTCFLWLKFPPSLFQEVILLGTSKVWVGTGCRNLFQKVVWSLQKGFLRLFHTTLYDMTTYIRPYISLPYYSYAWYVFA